MSLIKNAFSEGPILIPYIAAGDPDQEATVEYVAALVRGGAKIIELGLPFSEPIADGPVIQEAINRALEAGMTPGKFFELVYTMDCEVPIVVMTYYNIVHQYGEIPIESFVSDSVKCGISGMIIPDLPVEEAEPLLKICNEKGVDLIFIIAPTTREQRIKKIMEKISGFVYVQARLGTTGVHKDVSQTTYESLDRLREYNIPKAVGFGVSNADQAAEIIRSGADGVIAGSVFVDMIDKGRMEGVDREDTVRLLEEKARELVRGIGGGTGNNKP